MGRMVVERKRCDRNHFDTEQLDQARIDFIESSQSFAKAHLHSTARALGEAGQKRTARTPTQHIPNTELFRRCFGKLCVSGEKLPHPLIVLSITSKSFTESIYFVCYDFDLDLCVCTRVCTQLCSPCRHFDLRAKRK